MLVYWRVTLAALGSAAFSVTLRRVSSLKSEVCSIEATSKRRAESGASMVDWETWGFYHILPSGK